MHLRRKQGTCACILARVFNFQLHGTRLGFIAKELEWHRVRYFKGQRAEVERRSVKLEINAHVLVHMTAS